MTTGSLRADTVRPGLEVVSTTGLTKAFRTHRHDRYVVGITTTGVQSFRYKGKQRHALPGQVFAIHPDEPHDGRPGTDLGYGYQAAYVAPELISNALDATYVPFVGESVGNNPVLKSALIQLFDVVHGDVDDLTFTGCVAELADAFVRMSRSRRTTDARFSRKLALSVRDNLYENAVPGVSIGSLESAHGVDRFTIMRAFRKHFGVSPKSYQIHRRVAHAQFHIAQGMDLIDAALAAGFSDQSHMTRHFVRATGLTPGQWRKLTGNAVTKDMDRPNLRESSGWDRSYP